MALVCCKLVAILETSTKVHGRGEFWHSLRERGRNIIKQKQTIKNKQMNRLYYPKE